MNIQSIIANFFQPMIELPVILVGLAMIWHIGINGLINTMSPPKKAGTDNDNGSIRLIIINLKQRKP